MSEPFAVESDTFSPLAAQLANEPSPRSHPELPWRQLPCQEQQSHLRSLHRRRLVVAHHCFDRECLLSNSPLSLKYEQFLLNLLKRRRNEVNGSVATVKRGISKMAQAATLGLLSLATLAIAIASTVIVATKSARVSQPGISGVGRVIGAVIRLAYKRHSPDRAYVSSDAPPSARLTDGFTDHLRLAAMARLDHCDHSHPSRPTSQDPARRRHPHEHGRPRPEPRERHRGGSPGCCLSGALEWAYGRNERLLDSN
jgi:hypothetical protein